MATFVSAETLKDAIDRLGESRAKSTVADYLIFKRALLLAKRESTDSRRVTRVTTGLKAREFVTAITQLTGVADAIHSSTPTFRRSVTNATASADIKVKSIHLTAPQIR